MYRNKKLVVTAVLICLVIAGLAAVHPPTRKSRNLQVLPQDISDQKLDSIMDSYTLALGVECKFCHVPAKMSPDSMDYASDDEPMKESARQMMRMNILINKTYFYFDKNQQPEYLNVVSCKTCHRGEPLPSQ